MMSQTTDQPTKQDMIRMAEKIMNKLHVDSQRELPDSEIVFDELDDEESQSCHGTSAEERRKCEEDDRQTLAEIRRFMIQFKNIKNMYARCHGDDQTLRSVIRQIEIVYINQIRPQIDALTNSGFRNRRPMTCVKLIEELFVLDFKALCPRL